MKIEDFVGKIIEGDCVEELKKFPENSVDAIVTDPPAGISFMGKEWDTYNSDMFGKKGEEGKNDLKVKKNFEILPRYSNSDLMGFQNFICQVFTEAIRVLKPGGHALVWAIPRTSHHTAMGLERAGFEIRDVITHIFGSGFPKSLNIGKAMDKMLGNEREVIGQNPNSIGRKNNKGKFQPVECRNSEEPRKSELTKGTSEFEGLGTALKPASEHWILCRKPLSEPTIAQNCLKWGTGGINIDESRIPAPEGLTKGGCTKYGGIFGSGEKVTNPDGNPLGRFPANLILECICDEVKEGEEFVSGSFPKERGETAFFGLNKKHSHRVGQVKDKAIIHTNPECPCYILDRQSGKLNKQGISKSDNKSGWQDSFIGGKIKSPVERELYLDTGGASRFFYCAKSSRSERNMGCEGLEDKPAGMAMRDDEFTRNNMGNTPANKREPVKNNHPTVKPLALMEYLVKLISREGQIVLDPFAGSGSTLIACEKICRKWIGIEKESDYIKIAKARIKIYQSQLKLKFDK